MKKILLIDTSSLLYKSRHTIGNKLSHKEMETGLMFGFFMQVLKLGNKFKTNRFVYCLDGNGDGRNRRKQLYPDYKFKRTEKTEEERKIDNFFYKKFDEVIEHLKELGHKNILSSPGLEADDVIAAFLLKNSELQKASIIVSSDNDFYQLLNICKGMYLSSKGVLYTEKDFFLEWGLTPDEWKKVKSIAGCAGDSVPGVPGVGYKTAAKFIRGELSGKKYEKIVSDEFSETIKLAKKLTNLPFKGTIGSKFVDDSKDLDFDRFLELCSMYGFNSFISNKENYNGWKRFFEGSY